MDVRRSHFASMLFVIAPSFACTNHAPQPVTVDLASSAEPPREGAVPSPEPLSAPTGSMPLGRAPSAAPPADELREPSMEAGNTVANIPSTSRPPAGPAPTPARLESALQCPFPPEAEPEVASGKVVLRVEVDIDGRPTRVWVLAEPGMGFARAARACVLKATFRAGRDAMGVPTLSSFTLPVHFTR